jgi:hypothetical protein
MIAKGFEAVQSQFARLADARFQRRPDLLCRIIEGEVVILNREAGVLHRLNPTASRVWEYCDGTLGVDDIVTQFASAYDVDLLTCRKDVIETVLQLEALNLVAISTTTGESRHG